MSTFHISTPNRVSRFQQALKGFFAVVAVAAGLLSFGSIAHASPLTADVHGYAWSNTIGWVSLNCAEGGAGRVSICDTSPTHLITYKVTITANTFGGTAWNDNIGWIDFSSPGACGPSGTYNESTGLITGFARAISGGTGGWDGCINLGSGGTDFGLKYLASGTPPAGLPGFPFVSSGSGVGPYSFAWGGVNVGWLDFEFASVSNTTVVPPGVALSVDTHDGRGFGPYGDMTRTGGVRTATLKWIPTGDVDTCRLQSQPLGLVDGLGDPIVYPYWEPGGPSTITVTGIGTMDVRVPAGTMGTTVLNVYKIQCVARDGITLSLPAAAIVYPTDPALATCSITPRTASVTPTGTSGPFGPITVTPSYGVSWTGTGTFPTFTFSSSDSGVSFGGSITSARDRIPITVSGTIPTSAYAIVVTARESGGTTCRATITVNPPVGTGTGGGGRGIRFPYDER
jgi:hypothetical protein